MTHEYDLTEQSDLDMLDEVDGAAGMSASKMRKAASEHDFMSFQTGIP